MKNIVRVCEWLRACSRRTEAPCGLCSSCRSRTRSCKSAIALYRYTTWCSGITRFGGRITTRGYLSGVRKWKHAQIRIGRKKVKLDLHQENLLSSDLVCVIGVRPGVTRDAARTIISVLTVLSTVKLFQKCRTAGDARKIIINSFYYAIMVGCWSNVIITR